MLMVVMRKFHDEDILSTKIIIYTIYSIYIYIGIRLIRVYSEYVAYDNP